MKSKIIEKITLPQVYIKQSRYKIEVSFILRKLIGSKIVF